MKMKTLIATLVTAAALALPPVAMPKLGGAAWADVVSSDVLFARKAWKVSRGFNSPVQHAGYVL